MNGLRGKIVVVTGATGDIGTALCQQLAKEGAKVVIAAHYLEKAQKLLNSLPGEKGQHLAAAVEASSAQSVDALADSILAHYDGRAPDAFIYSVGLFHQHNGIFEVSEEDWDKSSDINLKSVFLTNKKFIGLMLQQGIKGSVVNISSIAADGTPHGADYSAHKAAMEGFSKAIAKEVAPKGIRVNIVAPGAIGESMGVSKEVVDNFIQMVPMRRRGETREVADLCLFLAGDRSTYITNQKTYITGGIYI